MTHAINMSGTKAAPPALVNALEQIAQDEGKAANEALDALDGPKNAAALGAWIDAFFDQADAMAHPVELPFLVGNHVAAARKLIREAGYDGRWLRGNLDKLADRSATAVAGHLIDRHWDEPDVLDRDLRTWILAHLDLATATAAEDGRTARFVALLWNDGDYATICDLIGKGIDTSTPARPGMTPAWEGMHSGYVQPIEHVLGNYIRLVATPDLPLTTPEGLERNTLLVTFGGRSPAGAGKPESVKRGLGEQKVQGAARILQALAARGTAEILTSYAAVERSELVRQFIARPGTIWGFEHVRLPYVQAAHAVDNVGQQPVRMWELWETVGTAMTKDAYADLMRDPDTTIPKLVDLGVRKLRQARVETPAEHVGRNTDEFVAAFRQQCTGYLRFLAEQAPLAKFTTTSQRGALPTAYLGAFACNAGLWWAKKTGQPVYYCLDGIKDKDVADYKRLKTSRINTFLGTGLEHDRFVEVITLAEIREILTNWPAFKDTVKFMKKGEPVPDSEIDALAHVTQLTDALLADVRKAPAQDTFKDAIRALDPQLLLAGLPDDEVMRIAAQAANLRTAATASSVKVLAAYLDTEDCRVLYRAGLLPNGFAYYYDRVLHASLTEERQRLARELIAMISDTSLGSPRVCDNLRVPLVDAVERFGGLR